VLHEKEAHLVVVEAVRLIRIEPAALLPLYLDTIEKQILSILEEPRVPSPRTD